MSKCNRQRRIDRPTGMETARLQGALSGRALCLWMAALVVAAICSTTTVASAYTQTISAGSLSSVSCAPGTTDCVIGESNGNAVYATNVSATAEATWNAWSGPTHPTEAVACPTSTLCVLADGENKETGGGGTMYYATSLGGSWTKAPTVFGAVAAYCSSSSFCVAGQKGGHIKYSTKPASTEWSEVAVGAKTETMNSVFCLSSSFCAAVTNVGELYIADTEAKVEDKEAWKSTDVDGTTALHGISCISTTSCVAVDSAGDELNLTIESSGAATVSKDDIDGTNELTAVTCASSACVTVDDQGNIFVSTNAGEDWSEQSLVVGNKLTSVSCMSSSLCLAADTTGTVMTFDPAAAPSSKTQSIDENGVNAASCIPSSTDCIVSDSKGNAYYATNVSTGTNGTWTKWSGPTEESPSTAVDCPTTALCVLADGKAEEGHGGKMYYATSLGGAWHEAYDPTYGVVAVSCASTTLCVTGQAEGYIRYTTKPASEEWFTVELGVPTMSAVDCLSSSFCTVVDSKGNVHIADTEAKIKEKAGWKSTDVDGTTALHGISCISTTSCVAVDSAGDVLDLTIESSGAATVSKDDIDGTNELTAVSCSGSSTCTAVDDVGNVFVSNNKGETWVREHQLADKLTSISCASPSLCLTADTTGNVTAFDAR
jgi:hypothetical protein